MADIDGDRPQVQRSHLTYQLVRENEAEDHDIAGDEHEQSDQEVGTTTLRPRSRPWSSHESLSALSPSPLFIEAVKTSKDDIHVPPTPVTPKRPNIPSRGLSLQMPPRDFSSTSTANLTKRMPSSPQLDSSNPYASVLPRRSRGLDFSRACTNLHHSTLAEQSSPDSSPVVGGRGSMLIPNRKGLFNSINTLNVPDSPSSVANSHWSTMAISNTPAISSSVGSVNMMECSSGSSSSDGDDPMEHNEEEDTIHVTPQGYKSPFGPAIISSSGGDGVGGFSPAASRLMSYQRARLKPGRIRKSSSSASGRSSVNSPGPASPPLLKSIESSMSGGCFFKESTKKELDSRRESLSLGTDDLQLSDCEISDDGKDTAVTSSESQTLMPPLTPSMDQRRNVIRRAVTRRGNMLPKSKNFARIRAALQEEGAPIDSEVKREAQVIRQVRESDAEGDLSLLPSQPTTTASSPSLAATTTGQSDGLEDIPEDVSIRSNLLSRRRSSSSTFTHQATRNSGGVGFWNTFDERMRTPPPIQVPRGSSSSISDDINMDTPLSSIQSATPQQHSTKAPDVRASHPSMPQPLNTAFEISRKGNKRMRDDDFDPNYFKRRAVSPGMSLQNSPILPQSPLQRDGGWWGMQPKSSRETPSVQVIGERVSSGGSVSSGSGTSGPPKRVGFQGMNDTNDGLMNMSIE